jgi:hypothetical protein
MTFARWQPAYAAHGVALLPCEIVEGRKKPLVSGCRGSAKIVQKFPDVGIFGFWAGLRNRITVLDVDTTDERVLRDALDRHGSTPLITRTASGKFHALYRHDGEKRRIRPWKAQGLPIDLLGGGLSIAPPSNTANGTYQIIEGSLDDLRRLPIMRGLDAALYRRLPSPLPTTSDPPTPSDPKPWAEMRDGSGRNNELFRQLGREAHHCDSFDRLLNCARMLNEGFAEPIPDGEVATIARSIWKYQTEGRNRFGQHGSWLLEADVDALIVEPHALALLNWLQAHNGPDSTFWIADGLADVLGWPRRVLTKAREQLIKAGRIIRIIKPRHGHPAQYCLNNLASGSRCASCGRTFHARAGAQFCSDTCRKRAHRSRQIAAPKSRNRPDSCHG